MHNGGFQIQAGQTLVCLGDSITQNDQGYTTMLAVLIAAAYPERGIRVVNAGIGGNKIPDLLARLDRDVLAYKPDWVTVSIGINDVWHGLVPGWSGAVPLPEFVSGYEELLDRISAAGATAILLPPTVIEEDPASVGNQALRDYRVAIREIGARRGLRIAPTDRDLDTALESGAARCGSPGKTLTSDGVHLRGPGDALLAVAVLKTLGFFGSTGDPQARQ